MSIEDKVAKLKRKLEKLTAQQFQQAIVHAKLEKTIIDSLNIIKEEIISMRDDIDSSTNASFETTKVNKALSDIISNQIEKVDPDIKVVNLNLNSEME